MIGTRSIAAFAAVAALGLGAGAAGAAAQTAGVAAIPARMTGERGVSVELLGFQSWTPAMLRDSLDKLAPGQSVAGRKFAQVLRTNLGFRDAFVARIPGDSALNLLIAAIEPGDVAHGARRTLASDTAGTPAWSELVTLMRKSPDLLLLGTRLSYARSVGLPPAIPVTSRPDSTKIRALWAFLETHRAPQDAARARQLLLTSPNVYDRVTAVAILANLEQDDASWHALAGALLDPDSRVNDLALNALVTWGAELPRRVDWKSAEADLRTIVSGSAVYAIPGLFDVLVATRVDPALAASLLGEGGLGARIFAGATSATVRRSTYRFLRHANLAPGGLPERWRSIVSGDQS